MRLLDEVVEEQQKHGIDIVILKNAGIARAIYRNNSCSPMGDLDLLVRSHDFSRDDQILIEKLGCTFKFRSEFENEDLEEAFRGGGTEYFKNVDGYRIWLE